jgi:hypothetical protein
MILRAFYIVKDIPNISMLHVHRSANVPIWLYVAILRGWMEGTTFLAA